MARGADARVAGICLLSREVHARSLLLTDCWKQGEDISYWAEGGGVRCLLPRVPIAELAWDLEEYILEHEIKDWTKRLSAEGVGDNALEIQTEN